MERLMYMAIFLAVSAMAYSQSPAEKEVAATDKVEKAKESLRIAKEELKATYPAFMQDAKDQIAVNDKKISVLRCDLVKPRKSPANFDTRQKINALEDRNFNLRYRLDISSRADD